MAGFIGMRGTGDWVTDQRPKNWREAILYRFPNGMAPLTAILSKLGEESVDDPQFHWWTKSLSAQAGAIAGIYTDVDLSIAYVSGGVAGDTLFVQIAEALVDEIRIGHQVLMRYSTDLTVDVNGMVTGRLVNGDTSYISVKLLEADDNSSSYDLSDADRLMVIGNINAEGSAMPDSVSYDPTKWSNFTQIFRSPLEMTRTALLTRLRTGDQRKEAKRECLQMHSIEMEKAFMFGVPTEGTGDNGKPMRTTLGLIPAIRGGYTGHGGDAGTVSDFISESNYAGQSWLAGGEHWLDTQLEVMFRYGAAEKLAFCGSGTQLAIARLVKNTGSYEISSKTTDYGLKVLEWKTPMGTINIMAHPMMSQESTTRNTMVIFEPENLKFRYITDTTYRKAVDVTKKDAEWTDRDGIKEEYLTEAGLEYHHPVGWGYLTGFGSDNTYSA